MIGTLALTGAVAGGVAAYILIPDVVGVVASMALAGFGLGGILGTLFSGGWRSPKPAVPAAPPDPEPEPEPEVETEPEPAPEEAAAEPPPPEGGEPGWYPVADGTRHYWDGTSWTAHVWRERGTKR
jgi:hypothetical protein